MDEATVKSNIRDYILRELVRDEDYPLTDDEGIVSGGLMDSFSLADLGVYVEDVFGVYIPDPDLTVEKMDTLNLMTARVMQGL
jgi:acyl carrier protein